MKIIPLLAFTLSLFASNVFAADAPADPVVSGLKPCKEGTWQYEDLNATNKKIVM